MHRAGLEPGLAVPRLVALQHFCKNNRTGVRDQLPTRPPADLARLLRGNIFFLIISQLKIVQSFCATHNKKPIQSIDNAYRQTLCIH
jgi:hypothetical protein